MLDHLGLNVRDLTAAKRYYDAMMPSLGFEPFFETADEFSYQPAGGKPGTRIFFYLAPQESEYVRKHVGLQHIAFRARTRDQVDDAHAKALELGSEILFQPQLFPRYHENYYAAFWFRPTRLSARDRLSQAHPGLTRKNLASSLRELAPLARIS